VRLWSPCRVTAIGTGASDGGMTVALLGERVVIDGWPAATVAEQFGISRATGDKWVRRYRTDGLPSLEDRSSRPHHSPRRSSDEVSARARRRYGPARLAPLIGHPCSTIYGVLRRAGLNRLRDTDRVTGARSATWPAIQERSFHQDHKKLGRVPGGGGSPAETRGPRRHRRDAVDVAGSPRLMLVREPISSA
jgi:transposase